MSTLSAFQTWPIFVCNIASASLAFVLAKSAALGDTALRGLGTDDVKWFAKLRATFNNKDSYGRFNCFVGSARPINLQILRGNLWRKMSESEQDTSASDSSHESSDTEDIGEVLPMVDPCPYEADEDCILYTTLEARFRGIKAVDSW